MTLDSAVERALANAKRKKNYEKNYPLNRVKFDRMCARFPLAAKKNRILKKWTKRFGLIWKPKERDSHG